MAGEVLGRLCSAGGWTYGALWCNDCRDPRILVLEESYHEEHREKIFEKVIEQIGVIGQGTIGEAIMSGKHRWINFDAISMKSSETGYNVSADMFQDSAEWQDQILAGIKTIAVIPLPSSGVLQFGSTQKIRESSDFIAQAQHLLWHFQFKQHGCLHVDINFSDPQATFDSVISSRDYSRFKSNACWYDCGYKQRQDNHSSLASGLLSLGSQVGSRSQTNSPKPYAFSMPVSTSSSSFNGQGNLFYGTPSSSSTSYQIIDLQPASTQAGILLPHIKRELQSNCKCSSNLFATQAGILLPPIKGELQSNCKCSSNLFATSLESIMPAKHIDSFSYMENKLCPLESSMRAEHIDCFSYMKNKLCPLESSMRAEHFDSFSYMESKLSPAMAIPEVFNMIPTTLHSSIPCSEAFRFLNKNSVLSHRKVGSKPIVDNSTSFNNSESQLSVAGKLLELKDCSSPPVSNCDMSVSKYSSQIFPFTIDPPENVLTSQVRNPESFNLIHSTTKYTDHKIHNNFKNNPIHSCHRTNYQLNNFSFPSMYSFQDVPIVCPDIAENVSIACSVIAALPNTATESPAVCVATSLDRGSDWNVSTSYARNQLISEGDMFDDMELDIIPMISRQGCWDDMELPAVSNDCRDFNTNLSDCISEMEMSSVLGSGKGLFSDNSSFEQLLDAVVAGNANVSTGSNSVGAMNSVISQDSKRHISTTKKHGDARIPAAPLSKCDIEKKMLASVSDSQPNCHIHTWIDDTCSVNAEDSALHQTKKLEESAKVIRKRARPGESNRPKPKDRQQIQDRVQELRKIVPNGAKCSIDSLLDRTIKYMLFLQSVTKYVDKVKQADVPKLIGEESGVVLKANANGGVGGATWAYEVAGQTMVCPILVEDVYPLGQMLVEILCEERGLFLEIADVVRSFGLTILKGDMEIRERKIWARFLVEANRDVTRMDIFLFLVRFLQQTSSFRDSDFHTRAISTGISSLTACQQQSPASTPIGLVDKFR